MQFFMGLSRKQVAAIMAVVFALGLAIGLSTWSRPVMGQGEPVVIMIKNGMTSADIAAVLKNQGIIDNALWFRLLLKVKGRENALQAGEYSLPRGSSSEAVIAMLTSGNTTYRQLTIPEGYTIEQIAKLINERQIGSGATFKEAARQAAPYDYMKEHSPDIIYSAEGYVFPDTYRLPKTLSEEELLGYLLREFDQKFTPQLRQEAAAMGLTVRQTVILASLVEKEAQKEKDRPIIAAVFLNRLKQDMPLQSCATIQYILGYPKAELSVQDTKIESPYNTYLHAGLPPGPIASPGLASIKAVLHPAQTDYLYFVADKEGAHHFSRTYEEHLQNIEKVSN